MKRTNPLKTNAHITRHESINDLINFLLIESDISETLMDLHDQCIYNPQIFLDDELREGLYYVKKLSLKLKELEALHE